MSTVFPRAVVLDNDKHHHYAVWVHRVSNKVTALCVDCGDMASVTLAQLERLKALLRNDDDVQVISWVEDNG